MKPKHPKPTTLKPNTQNSKSQTPNLKSQIQQPNAKPTQTNTQHASPKSPPQINNNWHLTKIFKMFHIIKTDTIIWIWHVRNVQNVSNALNIFLIVFDDGNVFDSQKV